MPIVKPSRGSDCWRKMENGIREGVGPIQNVSKRSRAFSVSKRESHGLAIVSLEFLKCKTIISTNCPSNVSLIRRECLEPVFEPSQLLVSVSQKVREM